MTKLTQNKILQNLYLQQSFGYKYLDSISVKRNNSNSDFMSKDAVNLCTLCDASKITNKKIYDFGDENSKILFITTVPTFDIVSQDMFVKMVENVLQIPFEKIYLTSIIKCDIKNNTPMVENFIPTCKGYILNQIDNSTRKIIVTLGDSYKYLTGDTNDIGNIHGNIIKFRNTTIIPIYHPSFLLRNPSFKKEALEDLKKIKLLMEKL
ncbi:MAG: uracil-DNA glycosylase [Arcobacter sp.]|nr:uracil-DNA glycosylase [Arcobacter sp.]